MGFGACSLANALPRQISPSGMLPPPIKVAVSRIMLSGGNPSGAVPTWILEPAAGVINSALRVGTSATMKAMAIVIVGGDARAAKKVRMGANTRLSPVGSGGAIAGGGVDSLCVGRC